MKQKSYAAFIFNREKSIFLHEEVYSLQLIDIANGEETIKGGKRVFIDTDHDVEIPYAGDIENLTDSIVYAFPIYEDTLSEAKMNIGDLYESLIDSLGCFDDIVFYQKVNPKTGKIETSMAPAGTINTTRIHTNHFKHCKSIIKTPCKVNEEEFAKEEEEHEKKFEEIQDAFATQVLVPTKRILHASDIYEAVSKTVICQDEQIRSVATSIAKNQRITNKPNLKDNLLICGPTGVGKTEMLMCIANYIDCPIAFEDATRYTVAGYVGASVEEMLLHLFINSKQDLDLAERGLLVIDEIDKLAGSGDGSEKISTIGVQEALLKILDGTKTEFKYGNHSIVFDTSNLTIVGMGAFSGIEKVNVKKNKLGFQANNDEKQDEEMYSTEAFTKYGLLPELIGRMGKVVALNPLSVENLAQIIKYSNKSNLKLMEELLRELGITLTYSDGFVEAVAKKAHEKGIGARSIKRIIESVVDDALYHILSQDGFRELIIDTETLEDNKRYILK